MELSIAEQTQNFFLGLFDSADEALMRGLFYDEGENRWSVALGTGGRVNSGTGHLWYDNQKQHWRVNDGPPASQTDGAPLVTGTGATATQGPVLWIDADTTCSTACSNASMAGCVDAWLGGMSVGCTATENRRICACR